MRTKTPLLDEKILEAAGRLFGTQRFHEVRMDDIAAEAAVSKDTLYRYFSTKEDLFLALLERAAVQINERIHAEIEPVQGIVAKLQALVHTIITFFDEHPHLFDLIQRAEVLRGPDFPWQHTRNKVVKLVCCLFEEGKKQGEFLIGDPDVSALLLLGGMRSIIRFGRQPRPTGLAQQIVKNFLRGNDKMARRPQGRVYGIAPRTAKP